MAGTLTNRQRDQIGPIPTLLDDNLGLKLRRFAVDGTWFFQDVAISPSVSIERHHLISVR